MTRIQISNDPTGRIIVFFPYDPLLVATTLPNLGAKLHLGTIRNELGAMRQIIKPYNSYLWKKLF